MAKNGKKEDLGADPNAWMVTFGDLITLLLTFFVLLLSMASMDNQKFNDIANDSSGKFMNLISDTDLSMSKFKAVNLNLANRIKNSIELAARRVPKTVMVELNFEGKDNDNTGKGLSTVKDGSFNLAESGIDADDSDRLKVKLKIERGSIQITIPEEIAFNPAKVDLKNEAKTMIRGILNIASEAGLAFSVLGHTDNQPIIENVYESNLLFSCARSSAIANYVNVEKLISADRIRATGFGSTRPVANNTTEEGRRENRRIELFLEPMDAWAKSNVPKVPMHIFSEPPDEITNFDLVPANLQNLNGDPSFDPMQVFPDM